MTDEAPLRIRKRRVVSYRGRGPIYNWLRAHADRVVVLLASGKGTWPALCDEMARHEVSGARGEPPTAPAAARVWPRVQRDLADALAAAPPKRLMPSRLPKDWRPEVVSTRDLSAEPVRSQAVAPVAAQTVAPFESGRKYEMPPIADEDLDLSEIPETFVDDDGQIKPRPLEARRTLARIKAELRWDGARLSRIMNG